MKPQMFIGSSVEGLKIAQQIELCLEHKVHCHPWFSAFPLSETTVESLVSKFNSMDFGLFVLSPDDQALIRNADHVTARDNVIFETGLFMGRHGRKRTFLVKPRDVDGFRMPTDLAGITTATYECDRIKTDLRNALSPVATQISYAIDDIQNQERRLDFTIYARDEPNAHWKLKVYIEISNNTAVDVTLRSIGMDISPHIKVESDVDLKQGKLVPEFHIGKDANGKDVKSSTVLVASGRRAKIWIPVQAAMGVETIRNFLDHHKFAVWHYEEYWIDRTGNTRNRIRNI